MLDDFVFGAATSAYQIEGGWNADGKVPSIWDEMSHTPGHVLNDHTGDIACNHYHRWKEDVKLMAKLGISAYRFSISWSRIFKNDTLTLNFKGLKFYQKLVNELLKNNITPFITLYHWDLPKWANAMGGWGNKKTVEYFKEFAQVMFHSLPRVNHWITFNEPAVFINNRWGHRNFPEAIRNVLIAHGKAVSLYRENYDGEIGISLNLHSFMPDIPGNKNDELAVSNLFKRHNGLWLDPIFKGRFPYSINKLFNLQNKLYLKKEERSEVMQPIDFLGINYYSAPTVRYNEYNPPTYSSYVSNDFPRDDMNVEIKPQGIYYLLKKIKDEYGNPDTYITENGCAYSDGLTHAGKVHDERRIRYIRDHLKYCNLAVEKDVNLKGYFYWSLMDNFEWTFGYTKRFGLVYIHYPTLERIPKDSYYWYKRIIKDKKFREEEIRII